MAHFFIFRKVRFFRRRKYCHSLSEEYGAKSGGQVGEWGQHPFRHNFFLLTYWKWGPCSNPKFTGLRGDSQKQAWAWWGLMNAYMLSDCQWLHNMNLQRTSVTISAHICKCVRWKKAPLGANGVIARLFYLCRHTHPGTRDHPHKRKRELSQLLKKDDG